MNGFYGPKHHDRIALEMRRWNAKRKRPKRDVATEAQKGTVIEGVVVRKPQPRLT